MVVASAKNLTEVWRSWPWSSGLFDFRTVWLTFRYGPLYDGEIGGEALLGDGAIGVDCQSQDPRVGQDSARGVLATVAADVGAHCKEGERERDGGGSLTGQAVVNEHFFPWRCRLGILGCCEKH